MLNFLLSSKTKLILIFLVLISSFGLLIKTTRSEDFTVTCDNSGCASPTIAIYNESNILPGQSFSRTMAVENNRSKDVLVKLSAGKKSETDDILLDVLNVSIKNSDNSLISASSLTDFLNGTKLDLGTIVSGTRKSLIIQIDFDNNANNNYQGKKAVFDIYFDVEGDDVEGSPTPVPTPTLSTAGFDAGGAAAAANSNPPVLGLTTFIRSLPGIFGLSTEEFAAGSTATPAPDIKGVATCQDEYYRWWLPLVIEAIILLFYLIWLKRRNHEVRYPYLIPLILAIISQIIHEILGCNCATGEWCPRYILINIGILIVFILFDRLRKRSKKS